MDDHPGPTQFHGTPTFIRRLMDEVPGVQGCKMSSDSMQLRHSWLANMRPDFCYLDGYLDALTTVVPLGAKGTIAPRAMYMAEPLVELWDAIVAKDWPKAIELQARVNRLIAGVNRIGGAEAMRARGIPVKRHPRWSSAKPNPEQRERLREFFAKEGIPLGERIAV
jgi:dihydrodipicolinate synthase/N-acetylneuraminate lyase